MLATCILLLICFGCVHAQDNKNNSTDFHLNSREIPIEAWEYPWFTAIFHVVENAGPKFLCGGAFIGSKYVLTARHCILDFNPQNDLVVEVGYLCPFKFNCGRPSHQSTIDKWHLHYGGGDLAMLVLEEPVPRGLGIRRVIPDLGEDFHPEQTPVNFGHQLTVVGGGLDEEGSVSNRVEKLIVEYIPQNRCTEMLGDANVKVDEFVICSVAVVGNACQGDSGSALIVPGAGAYAGDDLVVAVHSFGPRNCADPRKRVFGHFPVQEAADLIRDVACQGDKAEDWCRYPIFAAPGEAPWFTAIRRVDDGSFRCSGVLIGSQYALTASYCLDDVVGVAADVGYYCRGDDENCGEPHEIIPVTNVRRIEPTNIALLILSKSVSVEIQPAVPYLGPSVHPKQPKLKKGLELKLIAAGRFGNSGSAAAFPKVLDVAHIKRKKCQKRLGEDASFATKTTFCSIPKDKYPCLGDGGGPVVVRGKGGLKGRDVVFGIHSFGVIDCEDGFGLPVGHFEVSKAASLIQSIVCDGPQPEDWCQI